jgi:hypothetical protein
MPLWPVTHTRQSRRRLRNRLRAARSRLCLLSEEWLRVSGSKAQGLDPDSIVRGGTPMLLSKRDRGSTLSNRIWDRRMLSAKIRQ